MSLHFQARMTEAAPRSKSKDPLASSLPPSSVVLSLDELAKKYAHLIPFRMRVVNGFMAASGNVRDPSFAVDEIYSVHLVKETKVVLTHSNYSIPLNSTAKIGLIHEEQREIVEFDTVEELLNAKTRPKVVAVRNKYVSLCGKLHLAKNEVLIVGDVIKAKLGRSKVGIKVYSCLSQKEVVILKDHDVQFTTNPHRTQLYLTDLLKYRSDMLPSLARIYPVEESSLLSLLTSSEVRLERQETQLSVLISLFCDNPDTKFKMCSEFIDVPTRININVSILETNKAGGVYRKMIDNCQDLLHSYNPHNVRACVDAESDDAYTTQAQLLAEVRKEKEEESLAKHAAGIYNNVLFNMPKKNDGQEIVSPTRLQGRPASKLVRSHSESHYDAPRPFPRVAARPQVLPGSSDYAQTTSKGGDETTSPLSPNRPVPTARRNKKAPVATKGIYEELIAPSFSSRDEDDYESVTMDPLQQNGVYSPLQPATTPPQTAYVKFSTKNEPSAEISVDELAGRIKDLQGTMMNMTKQIEEVVNKQRYFDAELRVFKRGYSKNPEINRGMSPAEVQKVLDDIGLPQYKAAFAREAVDGELFTTLDEETLTTELGVTSALHRIKILKLMRGE